jgi:O-antigen/teichoic acid export membrane protein
MNPILSLFFIWSWVTVTNFSGPFPLAILFFMATVTTSLIIFIRSSREIGGLSSLRATFFKNKAREGAYKLRFPWALVVLAVTLPLVFQSDRLIISHFLNPESIGLYSLVAVLFFPLNSIITVGQLPLWPSFLKLRDSPEELLKLYRKMSLLFGSLGLALGSALIWLGPLVVTFVSPEDAPDNSIFVAFGLILLITGLNATPGMLLMDEQGRRVQAAGSIGVLALKILLSLWLVNIYGVAAILFSTVAGLIAFQNIPTFIAANKKIRSFSQVQLNRQRELGAR